MDLSAFYRLMMRGWWILVLCAVVTAGTTAYLSLRAGPVYRAVTTLVVGPNSEMTTVDNIVRSLDTLGRRSVVATYAQIVSSGAMRSQVGRELQVSSTQMRQYAIRTSVVPDTNILRVSVEGPDPVLTAAIASAVAENAGALAGQFNNGLFSFQVLDPAAEPRAPVPGRLSRDLPLAAVFGLLLGVGLVLVRGPRTDPAVLNRDSIPSHSV